MCLNSQCLTARSLAKKGSIAGAQQEDAVRKKKAQYPVPSGRTLCQKSMWLLKYDTTGGLDDLCDKDNSLKHPMHEFANVETEQGEW